MEGLSVAANGLAVISVAFQLTEACLKLYRFWESVEDAPQEIAAVKEDLRYLISIFKRIETSNSPVGECITEGIHHCQLKVVELAQIVKKFELGFNTSSSRKRKWTAFKAAANVKHVQRFRDSLNETKSTLTLALVQQCIEKTQEPSGNKIRHTRDFEPALDGSKVIKQKPSLLLDRVVDKHSSRSVSRGSSPPPAYTEHHPLKRMPSSLEFSKNVLLHFEQSVIQNDMPDQGLEQLMLQTVQQTAVRNFQPSSHEIFAHDGYTLDASGVVRSRTFVYAERSRYHVRHHATNFQTAFGCVYINTTIMSKQSKDVEDKRTSQTVTSWVFYPTYWLQLFGVKNGFEAIMACAGRAWLFNCKFQFTRAVPDDAFIFKLCEEGQTRAVELLLSEGRASVVDTSPKGWKPLHYAAANGHIDLCAMLIEAGADKTALVYEGPTPSVLSPISLFVASAGTAHADQKIAMLRLFSDCIDLSDPNGDGWNVHEWLKRAYAKEKVPISGNSITWLLSSTANEEYVEFGGSNLWAGLQHAIRTVLGHERHNRFLERVLNLSSRQLECADGHILDALSQLLAFRATGKVLLPMVVGGGVFLQMRGFDWVQDDMTRRQYLQLLPSIYKAWCKALLDCVENLEGYINTEVNQCLESLGWTREFLVETITQPPRGRTRSRSEATCTQCDTDYGHFSSALIVPTRITVDECAQTCHEFDCVCGDVHESLVTATSPCLPAYQGHYSSQSESENNCDDDDIRFHDAEPYILDDIRPKDSYTDIFSSVATLLYRSHGRRWLSKYTTDERLCATCFLLRERYTDERGHIAEFPPTPAEYRGLRFRW